MCHHVANKNIGQVMKSGNDDLPDPFGATRILGLLGIIFNSTL
jgi:hypothetical protein